MSEPTAAPYTLEELRAVKAEGLAVETPRKAAMAANFIGVGLIFAGWFLEDPGSTFPIYIMGAFVVLFGGIILWSKRKAAAATALANSGDATQDRKALAEELHKTVKTRLETSDLNVVILAMVGVILLINVFNVADQLGDGAFVWQEWLGDAGLVLILGSMGLTGWVDRKKTRPVLKPMHARLEATVAEAKASA